MPSARDMPGMRKRWRKLMAFWVLAALLLAGCSLSRPTSPTLGPSPTPAPRIKPSPTVRILNSAELYASDTRAIGETRRDLASFPAGAVLPPAPVGDSDRAVTVALDASQSLHGELYLVDEKRRPGLLLLGEDMSAWGALPPRLARSGFVTLVLTTRVSSQARHVETMLQSLIAIPGVDASRIGLIGGGTAADLALLACAFNSLCDALALLSPQSQDTLLNVLPAYGARPLWLAANGQDRDSAGVASALAEAAAGEARLVLTAGNPGAALLPDQADLQDNLIHWLLRHLGATTQSEGEQADED